MLLATVNEATMVPFVSGQLGNLELALALARRSNLPGAEALVGQNFERLFAAGQFKEAAEAAAESPQVRGFLVYPVPLEAGCGAAAGRPARCLESCRPRCEPALETRCRAPAGRWAIYT